MGLYAICVSNWNLRLTRDHFLTKHWSPHTHRCSAVHCWPWGVFIGAGQPLQHGEVRDTNLAWVRPSCGLSNSHSSTIAIGLFSYLSLIADLQCITIHHGEKQTWQVVRGTIHGNNIVMMCNQKMPQMGKRQLLYCVKARWTQPFAAYWTTYVWRWEMKLSLEFFFTPFLWLCL